MFVQYCINLYHKFSRFRIDSFCFLLVSTVQLPFPGFQNMYERKECKYIEPRQASPFRAFNKHDRTTQMLVGMQNCIHNSQKYTKHGKQPQRKLCSEPFAWTVQAKFMLNDAARKMNSARGSKMTCCPQLSQALFCSSWILGSSICPHLPGFAASKAFGLAERRTAPRFRFRRSPCCSLPAATSFSRQLCLGADLWALGPEVSAARCWELRALRIAA